MSTEVLKQDVAEWLFIDEFLDSPPPSPDVVRGRALHKIRHMADYLQRNGHPPEILAEFFSVPMHCKDYEGVVILAAENLADAYFSGYMGGEPCNVH